MVYYIMLQVLQNTIDLLKHVSLFAKCEFHYKMRPYSGSFEKTAEPLLKDFL